MVAIVVYEPDEVWTRDHSIKSRVLYQAELPAHEWERPGRDFQANIAIIIAFFWTRIEADLQARNSRVRQGFMIAGLHYQGMKRLGHKFAFHR